jgi:hypothetical protein
MSNHQSDRNNLPQPMADKPKAPMPLTYELLQKGLFVLTTFGIEALENWIESQLENYYKK